MARHLTTSKNVLDYWRIVEDFVYACGILAAAHKLLNNVCDPDTRHVVEDVVTTHFQTVNGLKATLKTRRMACLTKIDKVNIACKANSVNSITDQIKLIDLLYEEDRRVYYRRHIKSHRKRNEIVSLQEIEKGYQRLLRKRMRPKKSK